jgi:CRP-like cAMP-binding protein
MLEHLPAEEAARLRGVSRHCRFAPGEVVFHEQDPADCAHVIVSGRVAVIVTSQLGQQLTFRVMGPGELFGELALLSDGRRSATVQALETTETLAIHRDDFERVRLENPVFSDALARLLAGEVRRLSQRLREALSVPVETRVRRRLLDLAEAYGQAEPGTVVPLRQEDLASLSGAARATVNRVLREEAARGVVAVGRGRVRVLDPGRLRRRAAQE